MFAVSLKRRLAAEHFLTDNASAEERRRHRHEYEVTVRLEGEMLDAQGFLADIDVIRRHLEALLAPLQGRVLNDIAELRGAAPSIERLACFLCTAFLARLAAPNLSAISVAVAEDADASALYRKEL